MLATYASLATVDVQPALPATQVATFEYDKLDTILTAALVVNF